MKFVLALLLMCYLAITLAIVESAKTRHDPLLDPLALFSVPMPGEVMPTGWRCDQYGEVQLYNPSWFYCYRNFNHPTLLWVSVSGYDGIIHRTSLGVEMRYADLVAQWGGGWAITRSDYSWRMTSGNMIAFASRRRNGILTMQTRVRYVSFASQH